jgi:hypothetical protein
VRAHCSDHDRRVPLENGDESLIVLNRTAASVVEAQRGKHLTHVFTYRRKATSRMLNGACRLVGLCCVPTRKAVTSLVTK